MTSAASTISSNPSLETISHLLHRVSSKASKNLFGSQLTAIDCQLHISSSTNSNGDDKHTNGGLILSQSRLLIHQDLQHEAIPEEEYVDEDESGTTHHESSFFKLLEITHRNNNDEISVRIVNDPANEGKNGETIPKSNPEQKPTGETFLIVHRNVFSTTPNDNSCSCCYKLNSSTAMMMNALVTASSELRQECTILCVGDRSAGKTTFASIVSGLSLSIQRVLRLHATSLVNVWFDPSERDLQYFVDEFDSGRHSISGEGSDKIMNFGECDEGGSTTGNNRSLPLLPSQLCITSLHGLTEDVDLFLEDDELLLDDNGSGHPQQTIRIISPGETNHDYSDYEEENETEKKAENEAILKNKPNFTSVKIVEIGGDLLDVMVQKETSGKNHNNISNDAQEGKLSSEMLLIESAKNIFGTAQSILYFFDARNLEGVVVSDNELQQKRLQRAVDDFKYFLKCRKQKLSSSSTSTSTSAMNSTSLILVFSRIPAEIFNDQRQHDKSTEREEKQTLLAEKLFGFHDDDDDQEEVNDVNGLTRSVSFFDCFVQVAIRFMRLKRCAFSKVNAMLIPDFSPIHQSSFLGNLEDSSLALLQEALINKSRNDSSLFKLSNSSFINHARLAQLLFACHKFAICHVDNNGKNNDHCHNEDNDGKAANTVMKKVFELTIESCCRAIQFVFEESQHHHHRSLRADQEQHGHETTPKNNLVDDDDFCLSRNLEYCPPLFLARNVPQLLKLLVILEQEENENKKNDGESEKFLILVPEKRDRESDRVRIFVTLENCLALFQKYERKSLLSF